MMVQYKNDNTADIYDENDNVDHADSEKEEATELTE